MQQSCALKDEKKEFEEEAFQRAMEKEVSTIRGVVGKG